MPMKNNQTKSRKRIVDHGEMFTASAKFNAMIGLVKKETERINESEVMVNGST
jgi:hypothetical protein